MAEAPYPADLSAAELGRSFYQSDRITPSSPPYPVKQEESTQVSEDVVTEYSFDAENNGNQRVSLSGQGETFYGVVEESEPCDVVVEMAEYVNEQDAAEVQAKCSEKCPVDILHVIGDTSVLDPYVEANGVSVNENVKGNTKEKKPRRRGGKARKNKDSLLSYCNDFGRKEKKGLMYSREEMEAVRFEDLEEQKKTWFEVYCRLDPLVVEEYEGLVKRGDDNHEQEHVVHFDPRPQFQKAAILGKECSQFPHNQFENSSTSGPVSCLPVSDEIACSVMEEEYSQDDDSDEDYNSIQKPAFAVTGEPDFDSGPPQDGLEYLRRVRWEAAQIPKVKVGKVIKRKEQKPYMPQIPDIMECPENLLPLKEWEDSFLADFSELRLGFSQLESQGSSAANAINYLQPPQAKDNLGEMFEDVISENFDNISSAANSSHIEEASCILTKSVPNSPRTPEDCSIIKDCPTLSTILKMDLAARNSLLKKRISAIENVTTLSRNDCLWVFALCVTIDCPLDADTCAALRCLLRKCASLRAAKTETDDEVVMLNILATISGRYFGQLDK